MLTIVLCLPRLLVLKDVPQAMPHGQALWKNDQTKTEPILQHKMENSL